MTCKASEDKPKVPRGWRPQEGRPQTGPWTMPPSLCAQSSRAGG